jgi:hypothetical protein
MSIIPRVADLIRDPRTRESFRGARLGSPPTFIDGKPMDTRHRRRPSLAKLLQHDVLSTGDVIGRDDQGNFFVLVTVAQRTFQALCIVGERLADIEPNDNEDCGDDELPASAHTGPGNEEDAEEHDHAEEDDDAAGNVDEPHFGDCPIASIIPGEDSLGWSDNVSQAPGDLAAGCGFSDREKDDADAEDGDPAEANGDEGDFATCGVTIADQAIIDLARARHQSGRRAQA